MLCHVALARTDFSEERITSIIRVARIGELGTLAATSNWSMLWRNITAVSHCCLVYCAENAYLQSCYIVTAVTQLLAPQSLRNGHICHMPILIIDIFLPCISLHTHHIQRYPVSYYVSSYVTNIFQKNNMLVFIWSFTQSRSSNISIQVNQFSFVCFASFYVHHYHVHISIGHDSYIKVKLSP
jgi:hypothetical protein